MIQTAEVVTVVLVYFPSLSLIYNDHFREIKYKFNNNGPKIECKLPIPTDTLRCINAFYARFVKEFDGIL